MFIPSKPVTSHSKSSLTPPTPKKKWVLILVCSVLPKKEGKHASTHALAALHQEKGGGGLLFWSLFYDKIYLHNIYIFSATIN